jgi:hypothetical protein
LANLAMLPVAARRPLATERHITVPQAAERLQLSGETPHRPAQRGRLPGFKAGGPGHFGRPNIDAWVVEQVREKREGKQ